MVVEEAERIFPEDDVRIAVRQSGGDRETIYRARKSCSRMEGYAGVMEVG